MPVMVAIPCHTPSCRMSVDYACGEDNPKVLARDGINLADELGGALPWWRQMDQLRARAGFRPRMRPVVGDDGEPVLGPGGEPETYDSTVYYDHFVLSPDPADDPTLEQVRAVARAWAAEQFPGFQVAIGYHGDTGLVHAHVVVNGTDLTCSRRVTDVTRGQWCRRAWARLQEIARENGLSGFRQGDGEGGPDAGRLAREEREYARERERAAGEGPRDKAVAGVAARGAYSWVEDVRSRAECAARISSDPAQFERALSALRVGLGRSRSGGWMYVLEGRHRVTGARLGPRWTERGVADRLRRDARTGPPKPGPEAFEGLLRVLAPLMAEGARGVLYVGSVARPDGPEGRKRLVEDVAEMAAWLAGAGVACLADLDALGPLAGRQAELAALARSLGWLPDRAPGGAQPGGAGLDPRAPAPPGPPPGPASPPPQGPCGPAAEGAEAVEGAYGEADPGGKGRKDKGAAGAARPAGRSM